MIRSFAMWSVLGAVLASAGCRHASAPHAADTLTVAVSVAPEAWLVRQIAGPRARVITLVRPGENHHTYQPSDAQVNQLLGAAVFFRLGVPFESGPWFHAVEDARLQLVDLRTGLKLLPMTDNQDAHAHHDATAEGMDPHVWLSPRRLRIMAGTVTQTLVALDPPHQAEYEKNSRALQLQLEELDRRLQAELEPCRGRAFFVFHPAWGYFADDYGLRQVAIEIEGKEPSDQELTQLQREARAAEVKVVFVQPQISGRGAKAVAEATGARVELADPLAEDLPAELLRLARLLRETCVGRGSDGTHSGGEGPRG